MRYLYLSSLGPCISIVLNFIGLIFKPFMVYGYFCKSSGFRKLTRISSTASIIDKKNIIMGNNVWIWHHSIIDGSCGLQIDEGVQIGAWVGVFSHSSHISIRLYGNKYIEIPKNERLGYTRSPVKIGAYTFIGAGAMILPGVELGKGCLVSAGAVVSKSAPDFSILAGNPAKIIGSTKKLDYSFLKNDINFHDSYFDQESIKEILDNNT